MAIFKNFAKNNPSLKFGVSAKRPPMKLTNYLGSMVPMQELDHYNKQRAPAAVPRSNGMNQCEPSEGFCDCIAQIIWVLRAQPIIYG